MKKKLANQVLATILVLCAPAMSFAQSAKALTRDQVRAELHQLEQTGYDPAVSSDARYPVDLQLAEAAVATYGEAAQRSAAAISYGPPNGGSSEAGVARKQSSSSQ